MAECNMLQVHFRMMNEDTQTMYIMSNATVGQAKVLLCASRGSFPENQRFIFKGQLLDNNNTLAHYGVYSGSTVHVVSRSTDQQANAEAPQQCGDTATQPNVQQYAASIMSPLGVFMGGIGSVPVTVSNFQQVESLMGASGQGAVNCVHGQTGVDFDVVPSDGQPAIHGRFNFTREYMESHGGPAEMSRIAHEIATDFFNNLAAGNIDCGDSDNASDVAANQGNVNAASADYQLIFKKLKDGVSQWFGAAKETMDSTLEKLNGSESANEQSQNQDAKISENTAADANVNTGDRSFGISQVAAKLPWATLQSLESNFKRTQNATDGVQRGEKNLQEFLYSYESNLEQTFELLSSVVSLQRLENPTMQPQLAEKYTSTMAILTQLHAEMAALGCSLFLSKPQTSADNTTTTTTASGVEPHTHARIIVEPLQADSTEPRLVLAEERGDEQPLRTFTESPSFAQRLQEAGKPRTWSDAYMGHGKPNQSP